MKLGKKEWARWAEWIERVKSDLQATVNDRAVFHGFGDVVRANEEWIRAHHGGYFCDFVARSYVARSAIGVRRHVKRDDDSISLVQILSQMPGEREPGILDAIWAAVRNRDPLGSSWGSLFKAVRHYLRANPTVRAQGCPYPEYTPNFERMVAVVERFRGALGHSR